MVSYINMSGKDTEKTTVPLRVSPRKKPTTSAPSVPERKTRATRCFLLLFFFSLCIYIEFLFLSKQNHRDGLMDSNGRKKTEGC